jgi:hypothetical protein
MFSNEIIVIPDLVKLSTLSKFETGNTMYRTRKRERERERQTLHHSFSLKCLGLKVGK